MELDYRTIKALSSPTRIQILDRLLEKAATPTSLSDDLEKSKSTVSSHLSVLLDAGLVEKDEEEGRRRVTYEPTRKAETIVNGRERRIKFSVTSAIVSTLLFLGTGWVWLQRSVMRSYQQSETSIGTMDAESGGIESMDAAGDVGIQIMTEDVLIIIAILAGVISLISMYVAFLMRNFSEDS